ncbi:MULTISPECIES: ribosomal protein bL36 [Cryobacterium]|uniref:50S ribosomal protein L36 n=1 Tax=Cryobacterium levicorallinum TaxID=995038 RepID=A0A1I3B2E0_9MICO|nr:50S ribosomal protein L36 [Cryobacterium levicorallinum]TFD64812.1 50S ribosomal protein L36 [Cryobacterium sp. Hh38]GEP27044.1 hypothetical protein CLE01_16420 [Cryobacterium levicorallinum]SFH56508.1 hypothetical protein SAMN05216274_10839 [Cryobacterium levicorallinum]
MKVRNSLKKLPGAQIVHRRGRVFVSDKKIPAPESPTRLVLPVTDRPPTP